MIDTDFLCQVFRRLFVRKRDLSRYDTTHNAAANVDSAGIEKGKGLFNRVTGAGIQVPCIYTQKEVAYAAEREKYFPFFSLILLLKVMRGGRGTLWAGGGGAAKPISQQQAKGKGSLFFFLFWL